jgi:heat shock protein HtpX
MSNAKLVNHNDNEELYHLVENLCITSGLPLPKIYVINDSAPNAFATGRNPKNAVICVTSGLLQTLNRTELEAVIAHELSHIKNYDILIASLVVILATAIM